LLFLFLESAPAIGYNAGMNGQPANDAHEPVTGKWLRIHKKLRASTLALLTANLMPLLGVLALNWDVTPIMIFYWAENLVVGFYNVLKMRRAQGSVAGSDTIWNDRPVAQTDRRAMILFFIMHYGIFTLVHGIFVFIMFGARFRGAFSELGLALLFLVVSHGVSYRRNFIGGGEYQRVAFTTLFWQPYQRVVVMHITILAGGAWAQAKGSPVYALLVLVTLKTLIDLALHLLERRKFKGAYKYKVSEQ
jgi:hypothetical protein